VDWPDWWSWEIELTPHLEKRMEDRSFSEVELRAMFARASTYRSDHVEGRFVVVTRHQSQLWHVIVEPAPDERLLIVVTAYKVEP